LPLKNDTVSKSKDIIHFIGFDLGGIRISVFSIFAVLWSLALNTEGGGGGEQKIKEFC
jgi:hypothetical protein